MSEETQVVDVQAQEPVIENQVVETSVEAVPVDTVVDVPAEQPVEVTTVAAEPVQAAVCESCGAVAELFDVPHHQVNNPKVWQYCARCRVAHSVEVTTNEKLKEVMAVNPSAANDPAFVNQMRDQVTKELMSA